MEVLFAAIGCAAALLALLIWNMGPPYFPVAAQEKWQALVIVTSPIGIHKVFNCGSWVDSKRAESAARFGAKYLDHVLKCNSSWHRACGHQMTIG